MKRIIIGSFFSGITTTLCLLNIGSIKWYLIVIAVVFWNCIFGFIVRDGIKSIKKKIEGK